MSSSDEWERAESENENEAVSEGDSSIMDEDDIESKMSEIPETMMKVFENNDYGQSKSSGTLFSKNQERQVDSMNIEAEKLAKAEAIFNKLNVFSKFETNQKKINPLNNIKLEKKEREKQREATAGKAWGNMPKVELTEELKEDLRVLKFRKHIFPKRFYKQSDSDKLPTYFQIGTIVDDGGVQSRKERLTKKEQKGRIA